MPKFPFKKALIGTGVAGLAGASGVAGYGIGKRRGAESAAGAMASAFSEANQQENQQLARYFFQKGLQHNPSFKKESSMDKQAALQEIYNESFNDEIAKVAAGMPKIKAVLSALGSKGAAAASLAKRVGKGALGFGVEAAKETGRTVKDIASYPVGAAALAGTAGLVGGVMSERYGANLQKENKKRNFGQWLITPTINPKTGNTYYMKRK